MTEILLINPEEYGLDCRIINTLKNLKYSVTVVDNIAEIPEMDYAKNRDIIIFNAGRKTRGITDKIVPVRQKLPGIPIIVLAGSSVRGKLDMDNAGICSGDMVELLFQIETITEKTSKRTEAKTEIPVLSAELLTETKRELARRRRHASINKERISRYYSEYQSIKTRE